ncbi:MAG: Gfo/Idh/MocA family oxidoreductase [Anaerolineae bacterium]|nr:Gfo/Idh/MocA family oxidoreductase [Anaerolineae bacterium]
MERSLRMATAAVVGTGFIGPAHVEALRRANVNVKGILGITPKSSQDAAQQLGLSVAYPDYQAILRDSAVDVVHLATPNKTHYDMAREALLANKHVVCEKPLAMNSQETAKLVELAHSKPNLIAAVNYNIRFYPVVIHARDLVRSGAIGEIYTLRGAYLQDWLFYDTDWNWRLVPEEGGDLRAIGDIGTHWMDLLGFITGLKVEALLADLSTFISPRKKPRQAVATFKSKEQAGPVEYDNVDIRTEDWGAVLFHYVGGARGTMNVSQVNAGRKNQLSFEIAGSKGSIAWDSETPNQLWLGYRDKPNEILIKDPALLSETARYYASYPGGHAEGFPDAFKQLYRAIYGYLAAGDFSKPKPFPTFEDGHYEVMLGDAILTSHKERRWIEIGK